MRGISGTRLYNILQGMKTRCNNPNDQHYQNYGGKGIKVCEEWSGKDGAQNFTDWALANGYAENLTIDRKDSNGDYCPENCQWITRGENARRANPPTANEGSPIGAIRASTGLSQAAFGAALNIPKSTLQDWEQGQRNAPDYVVELIAYRVKNDPSIPKI